MIIIISPLIIILNILIIIIIIMRGMYDGFTHHDLYNSIYIFTIYQYNMTAIQS